MITMHTRPRQTDEHHGNSTTTHSNKRIVRCTKESDADDQFTIIWHRFQIVKPYLYYLYSRLETLQFEVECKLTSVPFFFSTYHGSQGVVQEKLYMLQMSLQ